MKQEKYYIFIDETGTASLSSKNDFFGIQAVCISEKNYEQLMKDWHNLRFNFFKNDFVIFHSNEINKKEGVFSIFKSEKVLNRFVGQVHDIFEKHEFSAFFIGIDIQKYKQKYKTKTLMDPYFLTLGFLLERIGKKINTKNPIQFCFESRGKKEDLSIKSELNKLINTAICDGAPILSKQHWIEFNNFSDFSFLNSVFFGKKEKICGLEVSDFLGFIFQEKRKNKESSGWKSVKNKSFMKIFP